MKRFFVPTVLTISLIAGLFSGVPNIANASTRPVNPQSSGKSVGVIVTYKPGFEPTAPNGETTGENFAGVDLAAPVVAGVGALIYSARPDLGSQDVYKILLATVGEFKEGSYCAITATPRTEQDLRPSYCCKGIVDAGRAVQYALSYKKSG